MREWDLEPGPRGVRLRICEWGELDGFPTVILHGFLEQGAAWDRVAVHLPGRVLAPDQRGHGLSGHAASSGFYHFWDYVPDLDALTEALGGKIDLVGHSMGGGIATLFAATRPEKVRRLVVIEGLGPPDMRDHITTVPRAFCDAIANPPAHRPLRGLEDGIRRMRRASPTLDVDFARFLAARISRELRSDDRFEGGHPGPGARIWTWDPMHRARNPNPFLADVYEPLVRSIQSPTLVVLGDNSPFVLPDQLERESWLRDGQRVVLPNAAHMIHHQHPERLGAIIRAFLAEGG